MFWSLQPNNSQRVCAPPSHYSNGCDVTTVIRQDSSNPSQWVPVPRIGMTLHTAMLFSAACCIPSILYTISGAQRAVQIKRLRRAFRQHPFAESPEEVDRLVFSERLCPYSDDETAN